MLLFYNSIIYIILGRDISERLYTEIRYHLNKNGAGSPVLKKSLGKMLSKNILDNILTRDFFKSHDKIERLANFVIKDCHRTASVRTVATSVGFQELIPKMLRTQTINNMVDRFWNSEIALRQQNGESSLQFKNMENLDKKRNSISFRKGVLEAVLKLWVPSSVKCLAALDVQTELHLRQNMINIKLLASSLEVFLPRDDLDYPIQKKNLEDLCDVVETHLKSRDTGIWSSKHLKNNPNATTGPACHCKHFCFNRKDNKVSSPNENFVCGHNHIGVCIECEKLNELPIAIDDLCRYVENKVEEEESEFHKFKKVFSTKYN